MDLCVGWKRLAARVIRLTPAVYLHQIATLPLAWNVLHGNLVARNATLTRTQVQASYGGWTNTQQRTSTSTDDQRAININNDAGAFDSQ